MVGSTQTAWSLAVENAFRSLAKAGKTPNFLFVGDSVLHIAAFNAFMLYQQSYGVEMAGVVVNAIPSHRIPQFGREDIVSLDNSSFVYLQNGIDYWDDPKSPSARLRRLRTKKLFSKYRHSSKPKHAEFAKGVFFLIASDQGLPNNTYWASALSRGLPVVCVLVEEGTGTYFDEREQGRVIANTYHRGWSRWGFRLGAFVRFCYERRRSVEIRKHVDVREFELFADHAPSRNNIRKDFSEYFVGSLRAIASKRCIPGKDFRDKVILFGTNFEEIGSEQLEIRILESVIRAIQNSGFDVYFRPHPRTRDLGRYADLGIEVDGSGQVAFEAMLAVCQGFPAATVGFGSSTQMLAAGLWEIPALTLTNCIVKEASNLTSPTGGISGLVQSMKRSDELFRDYFISVTDESDLTNVLRLIATGSVKDGKNVR